MSGGDRAGDAVTATATGSGDRTEAAPATSRIGLDLLTLTGLEVFAHHGVFDFERENGQRFVIDVELALDTTPAAGGDDLAKTVHYGDLALEISEAVAADPVDLIETLAERIAGVVLAHEPVERVKVVVHKPDAPITVPFGDVSITIERERARRSTPVPAVPALPAVLAFGSNLGERESTILAAVDELRAEPGIEVLALSRLYETSAVKPAGIDLEAPAYLNAVARIRTTLRPEALLDVVNRIENEHGRVREEHWGDRTLDVDIITMGSIMQQTERLTLPHPRAAERDFVLVPWLEIAPDAVIPGAGRIDELAGRIPESTLRPYAGEPR
ncbi:2-amino-4-hydroxy-6-hydroxymethyldihydropteridine diphosphokinase [Herbiconiux liukaitaii]|uniref:2-amino-4-hydroxy-6- hydroxymethyldihydropteridine diphosphokinase n=1 Tax=Herbiconiux liukaitaii TaxID=3342799 RepID=UPI0035B7652C